MNKLLYEVPANIVLIVEDKVGGLLESVRMGCGVGHYLVRHSDEHRASVVQDTAPFFMRARWFPL